MNKLMKTPLDRHSASTSLDVIRRALKGDYALTLFHDQTVQPTPVTTSHLDEEHRKLTLTFYASEATAREFEKRGWVSVHLEGIEKDDSYHLICLEKLPAAITQVHEYQYEAVCQLPESILITEKPGGVRIPFIQGVRAEVLLQMYSGKHATHAKVGNLSRGGCMVELPLENATPLSVGQDLCSVEIIFPNGAKFRSRGSIRSIRPFGRARHVAVGIKFTDLDSATTEKLHYYVAEAEAELSRKLGLSGRQARISPLFQRDAEQERKEQLRQRDIKRVSPILRIIRDISHQLHLFLHSIKNGRSPTDDSLFECVDALLHMVQHNRHQTLARLRHLHEESSWIAQAIRVGAILGDSLAAINTSPEVIREAVAGCLLHTMGKALLLSDQLPSLDRPLTTRQKKLLRTHPQVLVDKLDECQVKLGTLTVDIILQINERLDGKGYPHGLRREDLSPLIQRASLVKAVYALTQPRGAARGLSHLEAYRHLHAQPDAYNPSVLAHYIQRYGLYPIGSIVKFSGGFLACVEGLNGKGHINRVRVLKNLKYPDVNLDSQLSEEDVSLIGKVEHEYHLKDYQPKESPPTD